MASQLLSFRCARILSCGLLSTHRSQCTACGTNLSLWENHIQSTIEAQTDISQAEHEAAVQALLMHAF